MKEKIVRTNQLIEHELISINELLNNGSADEVYQIYIDLVTKIESNEYKEADQDMKVKVYISFAYFLFAVAEFQYFFEMLIKAQNLDYSREEIDKLLWEAFINPNLNEFKANYETNVNFLVSNNYIDTMTPLSFQELPYWLLPTGTFNEYYIYDKKQKLIQEKITLFKYQKIHSRSIPTLDVFSDYLLLEDWNWHSVLTYTNAIKTANKKTYILMKNMEKFLSCLQGALLNNFTISNVLFFDSLAALQDYFINSSEYLPRNIINLIDNSEKPTEMINEIHNNRTHRKENRTGDRVLLSICIPSYNRGNRAYENILHLLKLYYDEEIEFIISNNGTQNETTEYYNAIEDIKDTRIKYYAFKENMGFAINCCKICEMASGKFILLVSDEDLVNLSVLPSIMNLLTPSDSGLSILKTSTNSNYKLSNLSASPGRDALLEFMLSSNYMSGIIFNRGLLNKYNGLEYIKKNLDNTVCFYYPHMFWELLLCQYGKVQSTSFILITEGKAEKTECEEVETNSEVIMPYYASVEGRLKQHEDFVSTFNALEICNHDAELYREMYLRLCGKTLLLTSLSINVFYKKFSSNFRELLDQAYHFCIREEFYKTNISTDNNNYHNDVEGITQYYNYYKNLI
ncbi:glycosyl transferase family 2 [Fontibacillus phaseoli]|uniref:Glycosyl transferase family 2 n=1 Tax=Fontibacillus phaseoli TaxID=1416533 RepID=A0A369BBZ0_9BACL|nr:glycosyltransferase [Fontibacillus phaseoli]RCX19062.1 glycosyl transferase family 2 [Fontibacillus phaseoli]